MTRNDKWSFWQRGVRLGLRCLILSALVGFNAYADDGPADLGQWADSLRDEARAIIENVKATDAAARGTRRENARQVESTSGSSNSTSLVDQSSASDLFGIAVNIAGLSGDLSDRENDETNSNGLQATMSAYAFLAALNSEDALNPELYCSTGAREARRWSLTLGYENPDDTVPVEAAKNVTTVGLKWLFWNDRDACDPNSELFAAAVSAVADEVDTVTDLENRILELVYEEFGEETADALAGDGDFALAYDVVLEFVSDQVRGEAVAAAKTRASSTRALDSLYSEIANRSQSSLSILTRQGSGGADEYSASLLVNWGLGSDWELAANAGFEYRDVPNAKDNVGGKISAELKYKLRILNDAIPATVSVSAVGSWMTSMGPIYKGQAKLSIPIRPGIDLPISVTVSNRTELIDEQEVRAQVGFTIDTSILMAAATGQL